MRHTALMRRVAEILSGARDPGDGADIPSALFRPADGAGRYVLAQPDGGDPIPPRAGMTTEELDAHYGRGQDGGTGFDDDA